MVVVVVVCVVRVRPRHVVCLEPVVVAGRVHRGRAGVGEIGVPGRRVVGSQHVVPFYLAGGPGQHGDLGAALAAGRAPSVAVWVQGGGWRGEVVGVVLGRRDVGRGEGGGGRGADGLGLGRRRHHVGLEAVVVHHARVMMVLLALVPSPRVWVAVYPGVAGQLVRPRELFAAAGKLAGVRLLARVGADMARLVLEAVEGLVAHGALVGAGEVLRVASHVRAVAHRPHSHLQALHRIPVHFPLVE